MRYRVPGAVWLGLLLALAMPVAAPASLNPTMTLSPDTLPAGSMAQSLGINVNFSPTLADYPTSYSVALPAGLMPNLNLAGGACVTSATPQAGCQIGNGTATAALVAPLPVTLWLVKGPSPLDVAGIALVNGITAGAAVAATADVTLRTTPDVGINLSFASLPSGINGLSALNLTLNDLRTPTSCPSSPGTVDVTASSAQVGGAQVASEALEVTGCGSLAYAPKLSGTINRDTGNAGASFIATVTAPVSDAATQAVELDVPASVSPDPNAALTCLLGTACVIGTASASSPLLPGGTLTGGVVNLGGTVLGPMISVGFPPPFPVTLSGTVDPNTEALSFPDIPDLPLTSLTLNIGAGSAVKLFTTTCAPGTLTGRLTPWNGAATLSASAPLTFGGSCPGGSSSSTGPSSATNAPAISRASVGGLVRRALRLAFRVTAGAPGAPIERVALALPRGLGFARASKYLARGIAVRSARGKSLRYRAAVRRGALTITLGKSAAQANVTVSAPAAAVSASLSRRVRTELRRRKVTALRFLFRIAVASHPSTPLALRLRPKS